jgi:carboxylate-amine ligase
MIVRQNKWRASRFGVEARLVDEFTFEAKTLPLIVDHLVVNLAATAEELGCTAYLEHCRAMAAGPTWADRQLAIAAETGDLREIVRRMTREARISPRPTIDAASSAVPPPMGMPFVNEARTPAL